MMMRYVSFLKDESHHKVEAKCSWNGRMDVALTTSGARSSKRPFDSSVHLSLNRED